MRAKLSHVRLFALRLFDPRLLHARLLHEQLPQKRTSSLFRVPMRIGPTRGIGEVLSRYDEHTELPNRPTSPCLWRYARNQRPQTTSGEQLERSCERVPRNSRCEAMSRTVSAQSRAIARRQASIANRVRGEMERNAYLRYHGETETEPTSKDETK